MTDTQSRTRVKKLRDAYQGVTAASAWLDGMNPTPEEWTDMVDEFGSLHTAGQGLGDGGHLPADLAETHEVFGEGDGTCGADHQWVESLLDGRLMLVVPKARGSAEKTETVDESPGLGLEEGLISGAEVYVAPPKPGRDAWAVSLGAGYWFGDDLRRTSSIHEAKAFSTEEGAAYSLGVTRRNEKVPIAKVVPVTKRMQLRVETPGPWNEENSHGEMPGGICCQRAAGPLCYEHRRENWDFSIKQGWGLMPNREPTP